MRQEDIDRVQDLLNRWANWVGIKGNICEGAPKQCAVAPDARIQSIEDLEIEDEKLIVRAVNTAVWDLMKPRRDIIMMYYGFYNVAWRPNDDEIYNYALHDLYRSLRNRVCV